MDRGLAVIVMACTGGLIALQPVINAGLSRPIGSIAAASVSFAFGTLVLALSVAASGQVILTERGITPARILGGLLIVGTYLVVR
jgi:uncharacterized membrane protein YdcZ (DUF606 family)